MFAAATLNELLLQRHLQVLQSMSFVFDAFPA
jgi:hypothetical protein